MDLNQFKVFIKRPAHGPKKTDKTGFHRSGPVFLSSRIKVDRSQSWSFNFGPKDRTRLDLQTLVLIALLHEIPCFPCLYYNIEGSIIFIEDLLGTTISACRSGH